MPSSVCLEAQDDGVLVGDLVEIAEILEDGDHVAEHREGDVAALEAAEENWAVQDDVLAQRRPHQLEVLGLGGAAEGMRLGHWLLLCQATAAICGGGESL